MAIGSTNAASGGEKIKSIIAATYPEGSICTCSNGTKTLKAKDTSGNALFNVDIGTWTVSCTNGKDTATATASITAAGQAANVSLAYDLIIYAAGKQYVELAEMVGTGSTVVYGQEYIDIHQIADRQRGAIMYTANPVAFDGNYKEMHVVYTAGSDISGGDVGVFDSKPTAFTYHNFIASHALIKGSSKREAIIDISAITSGEHYPGIYAGTGTLYIFSIWLERQKEVTNDRKN